MVAIIEIESRSWMEKIERKGREKVVDQKIYRGTKKSAKLFPVLKTHKFFILTPNWLQPTDHQMFIFFACSQETMTVLFDFNANVYFFYDGCKCGWKELFLRLFEMVSPCRSNLLYAMLGRYTIFMVIVYENRKWSFSQM